MRRLRLRNTGEFLIIDNKDHKRMSEYRWYARCNRPGGNKYAVAFVADARGRLKTIYAHRVILNAQPGQMCDHRNGNSLDCRRSNLRFADHTTNARNARKARKANRTSEYKGVSGVIEDDGTISRWRARIHIDGRTMSIGTYHNEREAARAYDDAARKLFKEYARTNFNIRVRTAAA